MNKCVMLLTSKGIPMEEAIETCNYVNTTLVENSAKDTESKTMFKMEALPDKEERYVLGVGLIPNHKDSHGTVFPPTTVRKAAFNFMSQYQQAKFMHMLDMTSEDVSIVESYISPVDMEVNGKLIKKGTWMMGFIVHNDKLWNHIVSGKIAGLSIGAKVIDGMIKIEANI